MSCQGVFVVMQSGPLPLWGFVIDKHRLLTRPKSDDVPHYLNAICIINPSPSHGNSMMTAASRLGILKDHIASQSYPRSIASSSMAKSYSLDSKYRMLSGHDIPVLGYGVWVEQTSCPTPQIEMYNIQYILCTFADNLFISRSTKRKLDCQS